MRRFHVRAWLLGAVFLGGCATGPDGLAPPRIRVGGWPYPGGNVYGATKAFVRQFSLNLRADLAGTRVRVSNIEPGLCESEFSLVRFGGDQARYDATYAGAEPIQPQDIAETIFWILNQPAHININSLELMPVSQDWAGFSIDRSKG